MEKLFDLLGTESNEDNVVETELGVEAIIAADENADAMAADAAEVTMYSRGIEMGIETLGDLDAHSLTLNKLSGAPESVTPAVTALALESITATASKLGGNFVLADVENLSVEAINDAPMTGIEVGQEAIKDTIKKVVEQIKALWVKVVNGAKKLILKAIVAFNDVSGKADALKTNINKLTDKLEKKKFEDGEVKKIVNKLGIVAITEGKIDAKGIASLNNVLDGSVALKLAETIEAELIAKTKSGAFENVDSVDKVTAIVKDLTNTIMGIVKQDKYLSKLIDLATKDNRNGDLTSVKAITRYDGNTYSGIEISVNVGKLIKSIPGILENSDGDEQAKKIAAEVFGSVTLGTFSTKYQSSSVEKASVDVWSLSDIKSAIDSTSSVADKVKPVMKTMLAGIENADKSLNAAIKELEKDGSAETGLILRKASTAGNYIVTKVIIATVYNMMYNIKNELYVINEMAKCYKSGK